MLTRKTFSIKRKVTMGDLNKLRKPFDMRSKASKRLKVKRKTKSLGKLLKQADNAFSLKIRARDKHCLFPGCESLKGLQCSHYIGRATKSTRFDPNNCIALCYFHHFRSKDLGFEYQKQTKEKHGYDGQYTIFMRNWLGEERFEELRTRANAKQKITREFLTQLLEELTI